MISYVKPNAGHLLMKSGIEGIEGIEDDLDLETGMNHRHYRERPGVRFVYISNHLNDIANLRLFWIGGFKYKKEG